MLLLTLILLLGTSAKLLRCQLNLETFRFDLHHNVRMYLPTVLSHLPELQLQVSVPLCTGKLSFTVLLEVVSAYLVHVHHVHVEPKYHNQSIGQLECTFDRPT